MQTITPRRRAVLDLIAHHQTRGEYRLVRELAQELGLKGQSSLWRTLQALETEGYIAKDGGGRERLQCRYYLTPHGQSLVSTPNALGASEQPAPQHRVPVVGHIPAGPLAEALLESGEHLDLGDAIEARSGDFLLMVRGDSMTGDGILPGDYVLIRPGTQISNGEIAAVQLERDGVFDSTLKHVYFTPGKKTIRLHASNPAYEDMLLPSEKVAIIGAYRGLIRRS